MSEKIIIICDSFHKHNSAGSQMRDLVGYFKEKNHEVTLVTVSRKGPKENDENTFIISPMTNSKRYIFRLFDELLYSISGLAKLAFSGKLSGYDLIVWYSPSILWTPLIKVLSFRNRTATRLLILRDIFPEWAVDLGIIKSKFVAAILRSLARMQYRIADKILIQSPGNSKYFESDKSLLEKVDYFPNWLTPSAQSVMPKEKFDLPPSDRKIIIYSGNLGEAQGHEMAEKLIKICRNSNKYALLFVGSGKVFTRLRNTYSDEENTKFLTEVDPNTLRALYRFSSFGLVLLDPSHKSQNIPGKFVSYLRDNLPVIISVNDNNDLKDIVSRKQIGLDIGSSPSALTPAKFEAMLNTHLSSQGSQTRYVDLFNEEYSTEKAYTKLISLHREGDGEK